jgi:hypothetical protein
MNHPDTLIVLHRNAQNAGGQVLQSPITELGRLSFLFSSPELSEASIAAAAIAINFVADGVLFIIILVIIFGRIEFQGGNDFSHDRLFETTQEALLRGFRKSLLRFITIKNGGSILAAGVTELRIGGERIDNAPRHIEQFFIAEIERQRGNNSSLVEMFRRQRIR